MSLVLIGLDGEMSSAETATGGRLIQIGMCAQLDKDGNEAQNPDTFCSLICPNEQFEWNTRAAAVHGYTVQDIAAAPPAHEVDRAAQAWLVDHGVETRRGIGIGFNVAAFDMPHLALVLPRTHAMFARRTIDLNALCFTLEGLAYEGTVPSWSGWKRMGTTYAERALADMLPADAAAHDAGYDALLHLYVWRFLRAAAHGAPLKIGQTPVNGYSRQVQNATGMLLAAIGMPAAVAATGFTTDQLQGWSAGGRVSDETALGKIVAALTPEGI